MSLLSPFCLRLSPETPVYLSLLSPPPKGGDKETRPSLPRLNINGKGGNWAAPFFKPLKNRGPLRLNINIECRITPWKGHPTPTSPATKMLLFSVAAHRPQPPRSGAMLPRCPPVNMETSSLLPDQDEHGHRYLRAAPGRILLQFCNS